MKKMKRNFLIMTLGLGLMGSGLFGQIATPPVIDGDPSDAIWATAPSWDLLRKNLYLEEFITGPDDFSASIKVLWDADNFYCLLMVNDDTLDTESNQAWERDHWSIYFDMNNRKINGALVDDAVEPMDSVMFMLEKVWSVEGDISLGLAINQDTLKWDVDFVETIDSGTSYLVEVAVPFSRIGVTLADQMEIGFDTKVGDNDGDGQLDGKLALYQPADEGWHNMSYIGTAMLNADGTVSRVAAPPVIDGMWDPAWNNAMSYDLEVENLFTEDFWDGDADFSGSFSVMHDLDNIYVLLEVEDDTLDTESNQPWERDHWSVYFDINNHKQNGALLDDAVEPMDSVQFMLEKVWSVEGDISLGLLINQDTLVWGVDFVETIDSGVGYTVEVAVPFSRIGVTLTEGMVIGYDTKIGDNDGDGQLDHKFAWHQSADEGWHNAAYMGNMELEPVFFDLGGMTGVPVEPVIDGEIDGMWAQANRWKLERKNLFAEDFWDGTADFDGWVSALWTEDNFYVLLEVNDDTLDTESNQPWERDHWSIYFDISNLKQNGALVDDLVEPMDSVQFMLEKVWSVEGDISLGLAINQDTLKWGVDFVEVVDSGSNYLVEVCVPFSRIGVTLDEGMTIGWDAKIGDNDGDGQLDHKFSWNQLEDEGWHNMSYLGNVDLMGNGTIMGTPATTVFDIISGSADHTTLEVALVAAELDGALSVMDTFTVFAPVDAAFDDLPEGLVDTLLLDPTGDLADILKYHVVPGMVMSTDLSDGMTATTLQGDDLTINIAGDVVTINGVATVTVPDLVANNGVVHVIDAVLLPPTDTVGVEKQVTTPKFALYPNPATGFLNVVGASEIEYVNITNIAGQTVAEIPVNALRSTLDVSSLEKGMYIVSVHFATKDVSNRVFVKQ